MVNGNSRLISRLAFTAGMFINLLAVGCNPPPSISQADGNEPDAQVISPDAQSGGAGGSGGSVGGSTGGEGGSVGGNTGGTELDASSGGGDATDAVVGLDINPGNHQDLGVDAASGGNGGAGGTGGNGGETGGAEPDASVPNPDAAQLPRACRSDNDCLAEEHCSIPTGQCVSDPIVGPQGPRGEQGIPGAPGQDGTDGESCVGDVNALGCVVITCGAHQFQPLCGGDDGQNGQDGESCQVARSGTCMTLTCPSSSASVCDGAQGPRGEQGIPGEAGEPAPQCETMTLRYVRESGWTEAEWLCDGEHYSDVNFGDCRNNGECFASETCSIADGADIGWCSFRECNLNSDCAASGQVCDFGVCWMDGDGDLVPDLFDNCEEIANADQADSDDDWYGNVCDNCPRVYNPEQTDTDADGQGDMCEAPEPVDNDADNDTFDSIASGGTDCDDHNVNIHPGAVDTCGDRIDQDCLGGDAVCPPVDHDIDNDGYDAIAFGGMDCDDANAAKHPGAVDTCGDGIDQDCSGGDLACPPPVVHDADGDGFDSIPNGGTDCNDRDSGVNPGIVENPVTMCGDGVDQDCRNGDLVCPPADTGVTISVACLCGDVNGNNRVDNGEVDCVNFAGCEPHIYHWSDRPGDTDSYGLSLDGVSFEIHLTQDEACNWGNIQIKTRVVDDQNIARSWYGDLGAPLMSGTVRVSANGVLLHDPSDLNPRLPLQANPSTNPEGNFLILSGLLPTCN